MVIGSENLITHKQAFLGVKGLIGERRGGK